jgi:hypothetical protein
MRLHESLVAAPVGLCTVLVVISAVTALLCAAAGAAPNGGLRDTGPLETGGWCHAFSRYQSHWGQAFDGDANTAWQAKHTGASRLLRVFEQPMDVRRVELLADGVDGWAVELAPSASGPFERVFDTAAAQAPGMPTVAEIGPDAAAARAVRLVLRGSWPKVFEARIFSDTTDEQLRARREALRGGRPNVAIVHRWGHWWAWWGRDRLTAALDAMDYSWTPFEDSQWRALDGRLADFDMLVLHTLHQPEDDEFVRKGLAAQIREWIAGGGVLVVFDADEVSRVKWLEEIFSGPGEGGLAVGPSGLPVLSGLRARMIDPAPRVFREPNPLPAPIAPSAHFPQIGPGWEPLVFGTAGYPVLCRQRLGEGSAYVMSFDARDGLWPDRQDLLAALLENLWREAAGRRGIEATRADVAGPPSRAYPPVAGEPAGPLSEDAPVRLDEAGRLIVEGERFFPIGLYRVDVGNLGEVREAGFNTVAPAELSSMEYFDAAAAAGLRVLPEIWNNPAKARAWKDHPAVLVWYLTDEPGGRGQEDPAETILAARAVRRIRPQRPSMLVDNFLDAHAREVDIVAPDVYSISLRGEMPALTNPIAEIGRKMRQIERHPEAAGKARWFVVQSFDGFGAYGRPTGEQIRAMVYEALCGGARGLLFYAARTDEIPDWRLLADEPMWRAVRGVVEELRAIEPALLGDTLAAAVAADPSGSGLSWILRQSGGSQYVLAVNPQPFPAAETIELSPSAASVRRLRGQGLGALRDGRLEVRLGPLEAACWQIHLRQD